jgi:hypothetical protein
VGRLDLYRDLVAQYAAGEWNARQLEHAMRRRASKLIALLVGGFVFVLPTVCFFVLEPATLSHKMTIGALLLAFSVLVYLRLWATARRGIESRIAKHVDGGGGSGRSLEPMLHCRLEQRLEQRDAGDGSGRSLGPILQRRLAQLDRRLTVAALALLLIAIGILGAMWPTWETFLQGPQPISPQVLLRAEKPAELPTRFVSVSPERIEDPGLVDLPGSEYAHHYYLLQLGDRFVLFASERRLTHMNPRRLVLYLQPLSDDVRQRILPVLQRRHRLAAAALLPWRAIEEREYKRDGRLMLGMFIPLGVVAFALLVLALWRRGDYRRHALAADLRAGGDPEGLAERLAAEFTAAQSAGDACLTTGTGARVWVTPSFLLVTGLVRIRALCLADLVWEALPQPRLSTLAWGCRVRTHARRSIWLHFSSREALEALSESLSVARQRYERLPAGARPGLAQYHAPELFDEPKVQQEQAVEMSRSQAHRAGMRSLADLPTWAQYVIGVGGLAWIGYGWWQYWGPYRWLADLQLRLMGVYYPELTALVLFVLYAFAVAGIVKLVARYRDAVARRSGRQQSLPATRDGPAQREQARLRPQLSPTLQWATVAATLFAISVYDLGTVEPAREQVTVNLAELETGQLPAPASSWWKIEGRLLLDEAQIWDQSWTEYYVPLVSPGWHPGERVAVVVLAVSKQWMTLQALDGPIEGICTASGIPARVRAHWRSSVAPLRPDTCLLDFEETPARKRSFGFITLALGFVAAIAAGVSAWLRRRN